MPAHIPGRIATQIRINEVVYRKIRFIAVEESRNTNAQIEYALKRYVEEFEKAHGEIILPDD